MARRFPQPFWREYTRCWYVQIGKKQVRLSQEAEAKLAPVPAKPPRLVLEILDAFLDWCKRNRAKWTYEHNKEVLEKFAARVPTLLEVEKLKPWHVTRACYELPQGSAVRVSMTMPCGPISEMFHRRSKRPI